MKTRKRLLKTLTILLLASGSGNALAEHACRTGGVALANAYVHANMIYAMFFGDLQSYVSQNSSHFVADSPAVRCAAELSRAFMSSAIQVYDPAEIQRKQRIDAELGSLGISPGQPQPTASSTLFGISMQLARLARALPAAANGDYGPWYTPTNDLEQLQLAAEMLLRQLLQDPAMRQALVQALVVSEQMIRESAQFEYQMMLNAAHRLAQQ